jgi:hypothetical protein
MRTCSGIIAEGRAMMATTPMSTMKNATRFMDASLSLKADEF